MNVELHCILKAGLFSCGNISIVITSADLGTTHIASPIARLPGLEGNATVKVGNMGS